MSSSGKEIHADAENTKELIKSINFLSGEVAVFKEALSKNVSQLNETLNSTNKSIKDLGDSINESTDRVINSNSKLSDSQGVYSRAMTFLTFALVCVGIFQLVMMRNQSEIMGRQLKVEEIKTRNENSSKRVELINAMYHIIELMPHNGVIGIVSRTQDEQIKYFSKVKEILESQLGNPVLLESKECTKRWRNSISSSFIMLGVLKDFKSDKFALEDVKISAGIISSDVLYVMGEISKSGTLP